jgi:hypothetical protein
MNNYVSSHTIEHTAYADGNPRLGLGQAQKCG